MRRLKVIEPESFIDLLLRLAYNLAAATIIIRFIYYPKECKREYLFTFFIFNILIFFVCTFLKSIIINIGFAFGLFAIFTILRYRTETIPIREMTYQFLIITLGAINGLANIGTWHFQLLFINLTVVVFTFILDSNILLKEEHSQPILYEKIELIKPDKREALLVDLRERTGLDIYRIKINRIDFLQDTATITVYYKDNKAR
jgi:hypothetical protein